MNAARLKTAAQQALEARARFGWSVEADAALEELRAALSSRAGDGKSLLVFDRRWRLAADGFGLQRDDEDGPYVHIDDAVDLLSRALAAAPAAPAPLTNEVAADVLQHLDASIKSLREGVPTWASVGLGDLIEIRAALAKAPITAPLQLEIAEEARKDRAHAEAYYRQAEQLLTANEQTLRAERDQLVGALQRLSDQCDRLRFPGQTKSDAEKNALAVLARAAQFQAPVTVQGEQP